MKHIYTYIFFLLLPINSYSDIDFCNGKLPQLSRDDCFAFEAIIRGMEVPTSYKDIYEIPEEWINIRTLPWELGLIVLKRSESRESLMSLAYLNAFQLDGALSEIHTCVTLSKGKMILPFLNVVMAESNNLCPIILKKLQLRGTDKLCRDKDTIARKTNQLIDAINKGMSCESY